MYKDMQSSYEIGEIHEQKFMAGDCPSSVFSVNLEEVQHNQQQVNYSIPITQHDQFPAFYQQSGLHQNELGGRQTNGIYNALLPFFAVNFKLGLNENSGNRDNRSEDALLQESEQYVTERQPNSLVMPHSWQNQEDSAIKGRPFWKLPYKRCNGDDDKEDVPEGKTNKHFKYSEEVAGNGQGKDLDYRCKLFGELEAVYNLAAAGGADRTNQTVGNSPKNTILPLHFKHLDCLNIVTSSATTASKLGLDHGSESSNIGEETNVEKGKKRKKMKDQLSSMANFFDNLLKQLMNNQEVLHGKLLEVIERLDQQRKVREEAWREEEIMKFNEEVTSRAREQALASSREATIVSYLEKITGESINILPNRNVIKTPLQFEPTGPIDPLKNIDTNNNVVTMNLNKRWPKAEVEALIRFRSSLELKFQEPGLKGLSWEEISNSMASMGYQRSAKRCKEKWENINKYFKKTKESSKHRPQQQKSCPYFEQLDQLYSSSSVNGSSSSSFCSKLSIDNNVGVQRRSNSDLLDAIISTRNFRTDEMKPVNSDFSDLLDNKPDNSQGSHGKEIEEHEKEDDDDEERDGMSEGLRTRTRTRIMNEE